MDSGPQFFENSMQKSVTTAECLQSGVGVVVDIAGTELTASDRDFLLQPEIAGLILFSRNYENPMQLRQLTQSISDVRPDVLICVDQEGGRVQRFREGFTRLPAMLSLELLYLDDAVQASSLAEDLGWLMALELIEQGVHLSFAPVLDIERDYSKVIGDRAFGHDADTVTRLAGAFITGMQSLQMAAVGKHFPGHGAVEADSHLDLPVDERELEQIEYDMQPFAELMAQQKLAGVMPAHVIYSQVDSTTTAGFSEIWLQQILRQQLTFSGIIFSDDLSMAGAAAAGSYSERSTRAIGAGCNALLACNNRDAAVEVVAAVRRARQQDPQLSALDLSALIPPAIEINEQQRQRRQRIQQRINDVFN